jgi:hypothetical protein
MYSMYMLAQYVINSRMKGGVVKFASLNSKGVLKISMDS